MCFYRNYNLHQHEGSSFLSMILERIQGTSFPSPNGRAVHGTSSGLLLHREFSSNDNFALKEQMKLTLPHDFQSFVSKDFNSRHNKPILPL